jgi:hypothetical protein
MVIDHQFPGCTSSPEIGRLIQALAKAQAEFKPVAKSAAFGGDDPYRYSTWKDLCDALLPTLLKHGLVFLPQQSITPHGWIMVGRLCHCESGEWVSSTCPIRDGSHAGNLAADPRAWEIACTYAKKNLFLLLAGGWPEGDETEEQQAAEDAKSEAPEEQVDEAYLAVKAKVEAGLKLRCGDPKKLAAAHKRMEEMVANGELEQADCDAFKKAYPMPEEETASA